MNRNAVERLIQEAIERGDFDNLRGRGRPLDLSDYFDLPPSQRVAYRLLRDAGFRPVEVELKLEIEALRERLAQTKDDEERRRLKTRMRDLTLELNIRLERRK